MSPERAGAKLSAMANRGRLPPLPPDPGTSVAGYLGASPAGARVFFEHQMACVGCALSDFDTLADAARAYGLSLAAFLDELARAAATAGATDRP